MCCCDAGKRRLLHCHLCAGAGGNAVPPLRQPSNCQDNSENTLCRIRVFAHRKMRLAANIAKMNDFGKCLKQRRLERFVSENLCFLDVKYGILGRKKRHIGLQSASYWPPICRILVPNMRQINAKKVVLELPKSKNGLEKAVFWLSRCVECQKMLIVFCKDNSHFAEERMVASY